MVKKYIWGVNVIAELKSLEVGSKLHKTQSRIMKTEIGFYFILIILE